MDSKLRRFTANDWNSYPGAISFDGEVASSNENSRPFIGSNAMLEVIADINGLCVMPHYDEEIQARGGWCLVFEGDCMEETAKMLATRVLADTKVMYPVELKRYFNGNGFTSR